MTFDVGARLRALREKHGLSQRELAKRAGVTNSTISLIEQNRVSPSVSSLRKVLGGLPMTLAEFFAERPVPGKVFYRPHDMTERSSGAVTCQVIGGGPEDGHQIIVRHEVFHPGGDTGAFPISYPGETGGMIVAGWIELTVGDEVRVLGPGDGYHFDTVIPHRFRNPAREPCRIVSASLALRGLDRDVGAFLVPPLHSHGG